MCGTMNPVGNAYCDQCNARLIPMAAPPSEEPEPESAPIKGLSLPTIPLEEQEQQPETQAETGEVEQVETEDWLTQLRASTTMEAEESEESETTLEPSEAVELPEWLQELGPLETETRVTPTEAAPEEAAAEEAPTPAPAETPDWLRDMGPLEEAAPPEAALEEAAAEEAPTPALTEVPDWLQEEPPSEEVPPEAVPPSAPPFVSLSPADVAETPEWLEETAPSEEAPSPPLQVEPSIEEEAAEIPDWLTELETEPAQPSAAKTPAFEETAPSPPSKVGAVDSEGLARAEIPGWLEALRPSDEKAEAATKEGPVETEGLLEGLHGLLAPTSAIEVPAVRDSGLPTQTDEVSLARAQLLQSLLAQPEERPKPKIRKKGISTGERVQRWLVAIVLLIAVGGIMVAPLFIPSENIPALTKPAAFLETGGRIELQRMIKMYNAVESLRSGDMVLAAFEYGPSEADELNVVAEPILQHMLAQGVQISVVSTRPEGSAVATELLSDIIASSQEYTETQYTLAGYRPGDATGVSQLLSSSDTPPTIVLVLTAQPGPLRWWVEQARAQNILPHPAPPIVAGISAALEPAASPYLDIGAGQMEGAISGLSGAAAYELHGGSVGKATQRLNPMAAGHTVIAGSIILGALFYALSGLKSPTNPGSQRS
jgi:hypothetical protein